MFIFLKRKSDKILDFQALQTIRKNRMVRWRVLEVVANKSKFGTEVCINNLHLCEIWLA